MKLHTTMTAVVLFGLSSTWAVSVARAATASDKDKTATTDKSTPSWTVLEEEDFFFPLRFEPLASVDEARSSYLRNELVASANAIDRTVSWLHFAAKHAESVTKDKLMDAASKLTAVARDIRQNKLDSAAKLEPELARAADALADWHYFKANDAWGKKDERTAAANLGLAAQYLESATESAHIQFGPDTQSMITRLYTKGKLTSETVSNDHNQVAMNLEAIRKATKEVAAALPK